MTACLCAGAVGHLEAELLCHEGWLHRRFHALICSQDNTGARLAPAELCSWPGSGMHTYTGVKPESCISYITTEEVILQVLAESMAFISSW